MALDAIEPPEKVEVPPRAAEFPVGNGVQADRFLLLDDGFDLAVFDGLNCHTREGGHPVITGNAAPCGGYWIVRFRGR
jgi:hypothetical protein